MPSALRIKELRDLNDNVIMSDGAFVSDIVLEDNKVIKTKSGKSIINGFLDGSTIELAAPSGKYLYDYGGITTNGLYYIKPQAYAGTAIQCYVWFNSSYGMGAVLVASYASASGFRQDTFPYGYNTELVKNYHTTQNNSAPAVLPADFINALVLDSTSGNTLGGIVAANGRNTIFQIRPNTPGADMWKFMFATGELNYQAQIKYYSESGDGAANWHDTKTFSFSTWEHYNSGRSASHGADTYHYLPDDLTGGGEWWFRENQDNSCHQAYSRSGVDNAYVW